jgi:hypothetical protein
MKNQYFVKVILKYENICTFFKLDFAICVPFSKQSPPTTPFLYHEDSYDVTQKHDCGAWPRRNEIK